MRCHIINLLFISVSLTPLKQQRDEDERLQLGELLFVRLHSCTLTVTTLTTSTILCTRGPTLLLYRSPAIPASKLRRSTLSRFDLDLNLFQSYRCLVLSAERSVFLAVHSVHFDRPTDLSVSPGHLFAHEGGRRKGIITSDKCAYMRSLTQVHARAFLSQSFITLHTPFDTRTRARTTIEGEVRSG